MELRRDGQRVEIEPQVFDLLVFLAKRPGRVISKDEIVAGVWGGRIVSDSAIATRINAARRALGDSGKAQKFIKTVHGRGFRFEQEAVPAEQTTAELMDQNVEIGLPQRPSLVVLPFANVGDVPDAAALTEGLRIDIQNTLIRVSGLFIIAIASANVFRDKPGVEAAAEYAVQYSLEGSVRKAGNKVRVSVSLVDNLSNEIVWADQLDRDFEESFTLCDEVTAQVLTALNVKLIAGEPAKIWHKSLKDFRSLEHLYSGIHAFFGMTEAGMEEARRFFEKIVKWSPDSSVGPTWMALTHWVDFQRGWSAERPESLRLAKEWGERAITLKGCDGQAYTVLCHLHLVDKNVEAAVELGREAISVRPNCTAAHSHYANVLHYSGDQEAALHNIKLAMRFSPMQQPVYKEILARIYRAQGRHDQAVETADQAICTNPNCLLSHLVLVSIGVIRGQRIREEQLCDEVLRIEPSFSLKAFSEGQPYSDPEFLEQWINELRDAGLPE